MPGMYKWLLFLWGLERATKSCPKDTASSLGNYSRGVYRWEYKSRAKGQWNKTSSSERGREKAEESRKVSYTEELGFEMGFKYQQIFVVNPGIGDRERANWIGTDMLKIRSPNSQRLWAKANAL